MANKNTPAHDFAPAWLKIPSYETAKPSGADGERGGHTSRRDEHSFGFPRHPKENDTLASSHHQYFSDSRRDRDALSGERTPSCLPSYHHSLDFDDSHYPINSSHHYSGDNNFNGSSANSQSLLLRRPHSRHDFRNIPASYAKVETLARCINNSSGGYYSNKAKSKLHDTCINSNSHANDNRGMGVTSNNFNQEFPSLQGGISEEPTTPLTSSNGSVWEKPRNMKIHTGGIGKKIQLIKKPLKVDASSECLRKSPSASSPLGPMVNSSSGPSASNPHTVIVMPIAKGGSSIYRALIPANLQKKSINKEGMKIITTKKPSTTPPPSTHSMEILVKHPKAPGNKSEFLKALRNEKKGLGQDGRENHEKHPSSHENHDVCSKEKAEEPHMNGIDIVKSTVNETEKPLLSSSLEAEQRLLREMGWKEEASDDDNYAPLTEDELREFREITEKIAKKNGVRRNLQVNLSPRRLAPFSNVPLPADNYSSSSESDSDF